MSDSVQEITAKALGEKVARLAAEIETRSATVLQLDNIIAERRQTLEGIGQQLQARIADVSAHYESAAAKAVARYEEKVGGFNESIADLQQKRAEAQHLLHADRQALQHVRGEISTATAELATVRNDLEAAQRERASLDAG